MYVCAECLQAIESHNGRQIHKRVDYFEITEICDENDMVHCDFCEEDFYIDDAEMYEIF